MKNLKDYILQLDNWIPHNILKTSLEELKKIKLGNNTNIKTFKMRVILMLKTVVKNLIFVGEKN